MSAKSDAKFVSMKIEFPKLFSALPKGDFNTAAIKAGGTEYGVTLAEGLPLLEKLGNSGHKNAVEVLKAVPYYGKGVKNPLTRAVLMLCGRSEGAHSRGKTLYTEIAGADGDSSNKIIVHNRATDWLKVFKDTLHKVEAAEKAAATRASKKKAREESNRRRAVERKEKASAKAELTKTKAQKEEAAIGALNQLALLAETETAK